MANFVLQTPPIPQALENNLSDDELKTLALITLNWATAEFLISTFLAQLYEISGLAARDLVYGQDFKRKVEFLGSLSKAGKLNPKQNKLLSELNYAFSNFKNDRNVYAHGITVTNTDSGGRRALTLTGKEANPDELPLAWEQSKYVLLVATHMFFTPGQSATDFALPERPRGEFVP